MKKTIIRKPKELSEEELIEEVTKIELEAFDIITELVEKELTDKRKELSYSKDSELSNFWRIGESESINGSKTNGHRMGYAYNNMVRINEGEYDA